MIDQWLIPIWSQTPSIYNFVMQSYSITAEKFRHTFTLINTSWHPWSSGGLFFHKWLLICCRKISDCPAIFLYIHVTTALQHALSWYYHSILALQLTLLSTVTYSEWKSTAVMPSGLDCIVRFMDRMLSAKTTVKLNLGNVYLEHHWE